MGLSRQDLASWNLLPCCRQVLGWKCHICESDDRSFTLEHLSPEMTRDGKLGVPEWGKFQGPQTPQPEARLTRAPQTVVRGRVCASSLQLAVGGVSSPEPPNPKCSYTVLLATICREPWVILLCTKIPDGYQRHIQADAKILNTSMHFPI